MGGWRVHRLGLAPNAHLRTVAACRWWLLGATLMRAHKKMRNGEEGPDQHSSLKGASGRGNDVTRRSYACKERGIYQDGNPSIAAGWDMAMLGLQPSLASAAKARFCPEKMLCLMRKARTYARFSCPWER